MTSTTVKRVDKVFMEKLLGEPISDVKIKSFGSKKGDNVCGSLKAVQVTTKCGSILDLVCKCPPDQSPTFLTYIVNCRIMEIENEFYSRLLVDLQKMLEEEEKKEQRKKSGDLSLHLPLPFPRYFGGSAEFLMLEDMRPQGYKMADKYLGLSFLEASMVLEAIARFHALTYLFIRREGEKYFQTNEITDLFDQFPMENKLMDEETNRKNIDFFLYAIEVMNEDIDQELGKVLTGLLPKFYELSRGIHNGTDTKYFPVMCFGDIWVNNILFKYSTDQVPAPVDVKFIDFQQTRRGNIYEDLVYLIITSTTPALRKVHLPCLLQKYYDSFAQTLKSMNHPLPIGFTRGFFIDNFFENLINISVFVGATCAFHLGEHPEEFSNLKEDPEKNGDEGQKDAERGEQEEILEIKSFPPETLLPVTQNKDGIDVFIKGSLKGSERARERFRNVIQEFKELGVFS